LPFLFSSKTFAAIGIDENSVLVFKVRVQKDKVRKMATNYPNKAKIGECLKLIKKHGIEGQDINGNEIIFEVGARNPEIFTLRIEMPYK
jgi:hypothetical protein